MSENASENKNEIDWSAMVQHAEKTEMNLRVVEVGDSHTVEILDVRQVNDTTLVADVKSETLAGDYLWLRGSLGAQNGFHSLIKAANGGENIAGSTFVYSKVESEKSPVGYAHRWTQA